MILKNSVLPLIVVFISIGLISCDQNSKFSKKTTTPRPLIQTEVKEERSSNPEKLALWTPEEAARHQEKLAGLPKISSTKNKVTSSTNNSYANGTVNGQWINRGPRNMPGAFLFAEMLEGTDVIYGITLNHYPSEYNSTSYIHKGTVYNPVTGTGGDDFENLTPNWPNRYQNLIALSLNGTVRLIAHIESGPVYYSDDEGQNWNLATGLPDANFSSTINRQDDNKIYVTNNSAIYLSTDMGESFSIFQEFGNEQNSSLYSPRYEVQAGADKVFLARNGSFYVLNPSQSEFNEVGDYVNAHGDRAFSIGGDNDVLYVTENQNYWVSSDAGASWTQKFPNGNWFGDTSGKMSAGKFLAAHPEDPNIVLAGYAHPILSTDALNTVSTDHTGWGLYQLGTHLPAESYHNVIRFNYHPDFQATQFFYNSTGDLFSARSSDGGIFISYKEWIDFPSPGVGFDNSGYDNAHFINLNVLNTITPLVYRDALFTGANDPNHIYFGTQDQGSQNIIPNSSGDVLDFYQTIGGDGPSIDSYDGRHAWKWNRTGDVVYAPVDVYTNSGEFRSMWSIYQQFSFSPMVEFSNESDMGWVQSYIDHHAPDENLWMLSKQLHRAHWDGSTLSSNTIDKGSNQVAALAQASVNPDILYMLQDGKVFVSTDRGDTFGNGISTPFSKTPGGWTEGDIGSGVVLPGNDDWILFCGPSANLVGSILSTDGGTTWNDVTGIFPAGVDAQTGGMVVTPNGESVYAGTDLGAYVFDVENEEWFSLAEGIGFFNSVDVDYVESSNTVRFATFGSGILDFNIENLETSISEPLGSQEVVLYPNPTRDFITISFAPEENSDVLIDVIDLNGRTVLSEVHKGASPFSLNTSSLSSGTYLVKIVYGDKKSKTKKVVIE